VRPDVYIKGKDYERSTRPGFLAEKALVESLGGRVIFSSGDVIFSLSAILDDLGAALEADGLGPASPGRLAACCVRWGLSSKSLQETIGTDFANKTVAVVGDVIADRYIFCEASDVAAEAPILSVRPLKEAEYLGGAAIVAAHLSGLGAQVHLLTTLGSDASSGRLVDPLSCTGVQLTSWRQSVPIPTKERYLAGTQKLLKVDRGHAQPLDSATEGEFLG
jgi:bifunctional ADP-heptose synthase (sugar kinase/adenylyltransferase)